MGIIILAFQTKQKIIRQQAYSMIGLVELGIADRFSFKFRAAR